MSELQTLFVETNLQYKFDKIVQLGCLAAWSKTRQDDSLIILYLQFRAYSLI